MNQSTIELCKSKLEYNNLHSEMKNLYTEAEWQRLSEREQTLSYIGFLQGMVTHLYDHGGITYKLALLAAMSALEAYKNYLIHLSNPTSGTIVAEFGRN